MDRLKAGTRRTWLALEAEEIVELKQVMMDRDVEGARAFFHRVVVPQVRRAAERWATCVEVPPDQLMEDVRGNGR
ncbi:MAG: hypothetical protein R6X31_15525 [Anaerolineae bacterium]